MPKHQVNCSVGSWLPEHYWRSLAIHDTEEWWVGNNVHKQSIRSVCIWRCLLRHCLHCLNRVSLKKYDWVVESRYALHDIIEGAINQLHSRNIVRFEVDRKAQGHSTKLTNRIVASDAGYTGKAGISNIACLHDHRADFVKRRGILQFGWGRTIVNYVVNNDRLTDISSV